MIPIKLWEIEDILYQYHIDFDESVGNLTIRQTGKGEYSISTEYLTLLDWGHVHLLDLPNIEEDISNLDSITQANVSWFPFTSEETESEYGYLKIKFTINKT